MPDFYGTATGFRTYHDARNHDVSAFTDDDDIDGALLVASEWLDGVFRSSFPGTKVGQREQIREWPRVAAYDIYGYSIPSDAPPVEVVSATYEAALKQLTTPGSLLLDWTPGKYKRASVDGAVSVEYASFSSASEVQTQFATINQIIAPILSNSGGGNVSGLSGAITRV